VRRARRTRIERSDKI
jgi:hypothetical protein